ncbi:C6 zinc finger domain-containing [Cordyceps militaris]|uniref:C6 zinc finger domain-containing n=1 Tax=Cordyceps militaris TaxID=73501 RepID=A0A2H4SRU5_CORMI|nr:C6 zinc finger domain-containing [Cordyceps militaris]
MTSKLKARVCSCSHVSGEKHREHFRHYLRTDLCVLPVVPLAGSAAGNDRHGRSMPIRKATSPPPTLALDAQT